MTITGTRTLAQTIASEDAAWCVLVTIAGDPHTYCSTMPRYAAADATYRPWLRSWPTLAPERVDPLGGVTEVGEGGVDIVDIGDALTSEWRIGARPSTYLAADVASSDSSITVRSTSGLVAGTSVLYAGAEAMSVTALPGGSSVTVTRGALGTIALAHASGDPLWTRIPSLHGRRMSISIVPEDAASSAQISTLATYQIDTLELSEDLCSYVLRGRSQLTWLGRTLARVRRTYRVDEYREQDGAMRLAALTPSDARYGTTAPTWPSSRLYLRSQRTGEVVTASTSVERVWQRGLLGTQQQTIDVGDTMALVFGTDPSSLIEYNPSFFRWSPPTPSSSRSSGTWTKSAHWIDILLCLLTSSADEADGLELANRDASLGAWDALPVGLGIGVPYTEVDIESALAVRSRTPDYVLPHLHLGHEPVTFAEWVTEHLLRPIGAYIATASGQARIILPRSPLPGDTSIAIGPSEILSRAVGARWALSRVGMAQSSATAVSAIRYRLSGGDVLEVRSADHGGLYGQAGYYAEDDRTVEIDALGIVGRDGAAQWLAERSMSRLSRVMRPAAELSLGLSYASHGLVVGDALAVTHTDLPDQSEGERGWSSVYAETTEVAPRIDPEQGYTIEARAMARPRIRAGRIAPAARIVSASVSGGSAELTVAANRYTQSDAGGDLPATDAAAFEVGQEVKLYTRAGAAVSATTQTITNISGNVIRVDGDFSGSVATGTGNAGQVVRFAPSSAAVAAQTDAYVYWADRTSLTIGAGTDEPWQYGEP